MSQKHNFWTSFDLSVSYFLSSDEIAILQHSHGTELVATFQLLSTNQTSTKEARTTSAAQPANPSVVV